MLRSVPRLDEPRGRKLETIDGLPPNLLDRRRAPFRAALPGERDACGACELESIASHRYSACIRAREMAQVGAAGLGLQSASLTPPRARTLDLADPILKVRGLKTYFEVARHATVRAVDNLSFEIFRGETVGLVGESGCGKTTVGRPLLRPEDATGGEIVFNGKNVTSVPGTPPDLSAPDQVIFRIRTVR